MVENRSGYVVPATAMGASGESSEVELLYARTDCVGAKNTTTESRPRAKSRSRMLKVVRCVCVVVVRIDVLACYDKLLSKKQRKGRGLVVKTTVL